MTNSACWMTPCWVVHSPEGRGQGGPRPSGEGGPYRAGRRVRDRLHWIRQRQRAVLVGRGQRSGGGLSPTPSPRSSRAPAHQLHRPRAPLLAPPGCRRALERAPVTRKSILLSNCRTAAAPASGEQRW
ncbi:Hypothetical predicted protein [Marmota monax]|uniref:Uncharacterized protein n=1 Tax=Marmota monax TaxID=9995 RepID=A0A5E4ALT8_MARMO|nr:Hypothetical predicted protein [Marmota monax]